MGEREGERWDERTRVGPRLTQLDFALSVFSAFDKPHAITAYHFEK